ncbi:phosphate butyryltransferase [Dethiosulfatibacter aminovorans DSM 17477]|uniref:Phosphate butyryltransferase n=1 Tax=Dethiosulfatibacter aminovorans DSM 17477 TaxID=1121476 RepID=A0A1M6EJU6_9FIRM|nr:bifunctional enoyl-CoA hydratase/phosphate acetyltransferase [Dethiosulfatibacter aminovorans]SHI85785.1 phosphate butyryltransferase [Dethiosulfatibacter aminovorans DSM 17477]
MIRTIEDILNALKDTDKTRISVAAAQDKTVLKAVYEAYCRNIADFILVGDEDKIKDALAELGIDKDNFEIINVEGGLQEQAEKAVELVSVGEAQVLMKGLLDTSILLKALLKKEYGLRTGRTMSITGIFESPYYHKLFMITDPAINIKPDLLQKKQIIENAVEFSENIGIENPKVAVLCAKENVDEKMPETIDARELVAMNRSGEIQNCIIDGPLAFDNVISKEAAIHKGIESDVAGDVDIILVPDLVCGNSLYKSLAYLSEVKMAGVLLGAKVPVIITSRADSKESKLNSIALAAMAGQKFKSYKGV